MKYTKKITALFLALALIFALAGCLKNGDGGDITTGPGGSTPGDTDPVTPSIGGGTEPVTPSTGTDTDPGTPSAGGDTDPTSFPTDPDPDATVLGLMQDAAALGAAGLYGKGYTLVTNVTDPAGLLAAGSLDAAIVPVETAARIYAGTNGKVRVAAVTARGGWGIIERGNTVHNVFDLALRTVWVPEEYPGAVKLFTYIAEQYDFVVGDTLKLETVALSELAGHDLALMPAGLVGETIVRDADTRMALSVEKEWREITDSAFLPAACLVVRDDLSDEDLAALLSALRASQEAVSDNLDNAVALGLADNQEEAWASLEYLEFMWLEGADAIREELAGYFSELFRIDPQLIGGYIPDDGFYR